MLLRTSLIKIRKRSLLPVYTFTTYTYFHFAYGFNTRRLACKLDSLVRVSRRVGKNRFGNHYPQSISRVGFPILSCWTQIAFYQGKYLHTETASVLPTPSHPKRPFSWQLANFYRFLLNGFKSFNPLSKVLFIFPSQYLFAIGFPSIFSLGRSLSPYLSFNPKKLDSMNTAVDFVTTPHTGISPSMSHFFKINYASWLHLARVSRLQLRGYPPIFILGSCLFSRPY